MKKLISIFILTISIFSLSAEVQENSSKQNIFAKTYNFVRSLPFSLDIGTEGATHGSNTYFSGSYVWSPTIFSYGKYEMKNTLNNTPFDILQNEMYELSTKEYKIQFLPWEQNIFFNQEKGSLFTYGIGLDMRMTNKKMDLSGIGYMTQGIADAINTEYGVQNASEGSIVQIKAEQNFKLYGIGPLTRMYFKLPINKMIIFNSETFITPYMFMINKQDATCNYYALSNVSEKDEKSMTEHLWTYNSIEQTLHLDFFKFAAVVANFAYTHQEFGQLYPYTTPISTATYSIDDYSLSTGLCLISVGKTFVRFKTGIFYEWSWSKYNVELGGTESESMFKNQQFKVSLGINY